MQQGNQKIYADHMFYEQTTGDLSANGSVRIVQPNATVSGPDLKMNMDSHVGEMNLPLFQLKQPNQSDARGSAKIMRSSGSLNYEYENATYTTCPAGNDDWLLNMSRLEIDRGTQIGIAHNAWVEFKSVPLLYTPWMNFPLDGRRLSGFLGPVYGVTGSGGAEITLPYYWNIAPNYDATIAPRLMDKRGILLNEEFRYMGESYSGEMHFDTIRTDKITKTTRSRSAFKHSQNLGGGFSTMMDFNRVSDDAYFRDLSNTVYGATQTQLESVGELSYAADWWNASIKAQTFQTLQNPFAPVAIPYQRWPQINLTAQKGFGDSLVSMENEYVDFHHPTKVNGRRMVLYPSIVYDLISDPGFYLKPKLGIHNTQYAMGINDNGGIPHFSRTLPIFSLDSGMTFERDMTLGSGEYLQTLEPRAYYVNIPYQYQDFLPNYDSPPKPFNFTQMFTENRFFGNDRISDANMVTVALTSRLIDNAGGMERLRVAVGERLSFETQKMYPDTNNRSKILLEAGGRVTNALTLNGLLEYDPNTAHTLSYNATGGYTPETGKVLNLGYRYTRVGDIPENDVRQTDFSIQWPLIRNWHLVSRLTFSLNERRILEELAGLEYNQSCWILRLVAQKFPIPGQHTSTGIFMQLELRDLVAVGSDPLTALRTSIPGYSKLGTPSTDQSAQGLQ
ncbi:MAG: LPS assembly protein LptD [Gallionellaceae bacterium]